MPSPLQIGLMIFPGVTQLDFTGPLQVFSSVPGAAVHLIWKRIEPVASDSVMMLTPTISFADCPQLDVICVPGGFGTDDLVNDEEVLDFLRRQTAGAKYVTSVCTGSLVLGAAGLLKGYRATTHWTAMDLLAAFGATPANTRVCVDRNRITGGGDSGAHERENCALQEAPCRGRRPRRRTAGVNLPPLAQKKAARFPERPFLILRQPHINGRFQDLNTGGLSPSHILIGSRCISGQSRTVARTDAVDFPSP